MSSELQGLLKNYYDSDKNLCQFFKITKESNENFIFLDKTNVYWVQFKEDEICWSEKMHEAKNEDFSGSAYISKGPFEGKDQIIIFLVEEGYDKYYSILDRKKRVAYYKDDDSNGS